MALVSSETLIIFIASLIVATTVAGTMTSGVNQLTAAVDDRSGDISAEIRTDVEIISAPSSGKIYNDTTNNVTLLVKNTGSGTLDHDPSGFDVILDGTYRTNVTTTVIDGSSWTVGSVVRLTVSNVTLNAGEDHRVVVVVNGNREVFEFRT
ncbi:MAG: flagellar protein G [Halanaeroarchaeum sp.]